ncbi:MerR family transcriptional regulator [Spongiactinospora sp. TRM90649]|uniref:MerR family transcriptional regulator n=1 Tax=Spongiactinospora sp. TRM90649 TaxID=3031114 RepID=UPI0023F6948D|nr:MerR family transcriptional regulator [Spongiactinospora sp. TRM90649]MDF5754980.1 MerR family transcriptional regulator [Spongiactinospora sp. TRM90649]
MWRIGQLARMAGVSERTLRHYDKIGLLTPAAVDRSTGYRRYGVAELARLERIRGLQRLGLPLRRIADLLDAPEEHLRQALAEIVTGIRRDIAALTAAATYAEDHLATPMSILPQQTTVTSRRLRVHRLCLDHPSELAALCPAPPATLLTWLRGYPAGGFTAAVTTDHDGERLTLPARAVVRAVVPPSTNVIRAGQDLFTWLHRHHLAVTGPTVEDHLIDADGAQAVVLELSVRPQTSPDPEASPTGHETPVPPIPQ